MSLTCRIEGCTRKHLAKGMCKLHYYRNLRYGSPTASVIRMATWKGMKCRHSECSKEAKLKGLCEAHYVSIRRKADPVKQKIRTENYTARKIARQEKLLGRSRPDICDVCKSRGYTHLTNRPSIVFDHDHITGNARGWLCDRCNKVLGLVKDDVGVLGALRTYLESNSYGQINNCAA